MSDGKRRVLWVIKGLGPGGAERLLCAAARAHDHDRLHIECAYVLPWKDHLAEELEQAGVRTHCMSKRRVDRLWPLRLARIVRSGDWDVIHVHSPLPGSVARLAARTLPKASRPMVVSTEHNRWATHRMPTRWVNRLTSRWDAVSFAVTDEVKHSMSGPVAHRVETLRHGIDVEAVSKARASRTEIRRELGISDEEFVVGTVANFRAQKDYPNLLKAARLLADRDVPVRIVAVGQGPQEAQVRNLHEELRLGERVILTGFRDDAVRVLGACDAFTLASRWEGLPVALMEALALGLPVVGTAVGGVAEELTDRIDALLVPSGDAQALAAAIERLVEDDGLRGALNAASLRRARDFDVRHALKRIEQVYGCVSPYGQSPAPQNNPPALRPTGLDVRPATPDDRQAILELCRASLGWGNDPRFEQLFSWKHYQNAFGPSYMWVATDAGRVIGLRAFMRWEFTRGSEVLRAVRAVDTAVHPDYQGKGLFTAMTLRALDEVGEEGIHFVFNTPNDKSRPGYLKMGWQIVGRIPISVKPRGPVGSWNLAKSRVASSHWPESIGAGTEISEVINSLSIQTHDGNMYPRRLVTRMSGDFLVWRYGAPFLGYQVIGSEEGTMILRIRRRGSSKELVLLYADGLSNRSVSSRLAALAREVDANHVLVVGTRLTGSGFVPIPCGGPILTCRSVNSAAVPPLANWGMTMGDLELF